MKWLNRWREKRKWGVLLDIAKHESHKCFVKWDKMLYAKSKITILEAKSSEELSRKWEEFYNPINKGGRRLGSLCSIDDKKFSVHNGTFCLMIEYKQFSLRNNVETEDYQKVIGEYDQIKARIKELEEKIYGMKKPL